MKTIGWVIGLLGAGFVAAAGTAVFFYLAAHDSEAEAGALREQAGGRQAIGAASAGSAEVVRLRKRVAELEMALASAQAGAGEAAAPAAAESGEAGTGKGGGAMMKNLMKMMADPAMKDAMRGQQRVALVGLFADLFQQLELSEEAEAAVTELLLDKQMMNMEMGMALMDQSRTEGERKDLAEKMKEETERFDREIEEALGKEAFERYELFVDSQQERQQLSSFKESLKARGLELDYAAEEQLMNAMYETRKGFKFTTDFGTDAKPNPEAWFGFDMERADRLFAETRRLQQEVAAKAAAFLTPEQLEAFRTSQESQLKMQEMGIKMGLQMQE